MHWVEGYLVACMSHYIVDPTRLCDPCICTLPGMCDQRHYDQVLYVRESNCLVLPLSDIRRARIGGVRISDIRLYHELSTTS